MEINTNIHKVDMKKLNSYIRIFDDVLPEKTLNIFDKIVKNHFKFDKASIVKNNQGDQEVNNNIRNTENKCLNFNDESLTAVHWLYVLGSFFNKHLNMYIKDFKMNDFSVTINDMQVLKYEKGGHYKFHVDSCPTIFRTLSLIYFVNDNYEGGDLVFKLIGTEEILKIDKKKNRLVIWPSNFMYPHCVTPVEEGIRYSVVSWAV